ncbi:hypothetical protein B0T22DRAFT_376021 [Podospora appendiculata]|uniref:Transmembrane protein 53 n=1 Tax=Podospora appendiculata TaxID=314037 RepID=A0AAE1CE02_9PEZI|nr:hypothetical protein B0T22DRAFT_376021 [Podospora appendiculata]
MRPSRRVGVARAAVKKSRSTRPFVPGFRYIGPSVYVQDTRPNKNLNNSTAQLPQQPPAASSSSRSLSPFNTTEANPAPDLVIITSWTGAVPKHIAKYTEAYNQLFPDTPILVITTTIADLAIHRTKTKIATLAPAVEFLCQDPNIITTPTTHTKPRPNLPNAKPFYTNILIHAFSEGGAHKAVLLAQALQSATKGHHKLPLAALILDSAPGTPRYSSNVAAFHRSLPPNRMVRAVGMPLGASVLAVTWVLFSIVVGYDNNLISRTRRALNDASLWAVSGVPRTYLFSEADDLIWWEDVEEHGVASAEVTGDGRCLLVKFRGTKHCGHARGNEELYWGAVRRTWEARGAVRGVGE